MTNIKTANHIHFTGIKGVGMTATACAAQDLGAKVSGSDVAETFVTDPILAKRQIVVKNDFSPDHILSSIDLVVFTGAHQGDQNPEVKAAQKKGIPTITQAEAIGQLMADKIGISVCGVGGKSTTASMIATILTAAGKHPSYVIGVASINNLGVAGKYDSKGKYFVAEADEYATIPGTDLTPKFMFQDPQIIVTTNIAYDHPDVYPSLEKTKAAFTAFFQKLAPTGTLVYNADDPNADFIRSPNFSTVTFGVKKSANLQLKKTFYQRDRMHYVFEYKNQEYQGILAVPGEHNVKNALAALAACRALGLISIDDCLPALTSFTGTKRRLEVVGEKDGIVFLDDYAHHPSEIIAVLQTVKNWLRKRRLVVVFEPHTFSRTKALFHQFTTSFSLADQVIITDIFASARETNDPTVSAASLAQAIKKQKVATAYCPRPSLVEYVKAVLKPHDALLTLGAGTIYQLHHELLS